MCKIIVRYVLFDDGPLEMCLKRLPDGSYRSADATAMVFPARRVKAWEELTEEQKKNCRFSAAVEMQMEG